MNRYRISTNTNEMDINLVHGFLAQSYWATGIPIDTLQKAMENSLCFAAFENVYQVGFARVVTDFATFAYLADVFVIESHRGKGVSKKIITAVVDHPRLQGLRRFSLATLDAHALYEQFGFKPLAHPGTFMEIWDPDVYKGSKNKAI